MSSDSGRYYVGATGRWTANLLQEDGETKIGVDKITSATVTLIDAGSRTYIRGTSTVPQDIWPVPGSTGFLIEDTTDEQGNAITRIGWDVGTGDVAIQTDGMLSETHVLDLTVNYKNDANVSKVLRHTHRMRCIEAPLVCEFADVDLQVGLDPKTSRVLVEDMIDAVAEIFQTRTRRKIRKSTEATPTTTILSTFKGQRVLQLDRYPIDGVGGVWESLVPTDFSGGLVDPSVYAADAERGTVEIITGQWLYGVKCIKVSHWGGIANDVSDMPADIRFICARQVGAWWKRRDQMGLLSVSVPGSSISIYSQAPTIKEFDMLVRDYKIRLRP